MWFSPPHRRLNQTKFMPLLWAQTDWYSYRLCRCIWPCVPRGRLEVNSVWLPLSSRAFFEVGSFTEIGTFTRTLGLEFRSSSYYKRSAHGALSLFPDPKRILNCYCCHSEHSEPSAALDNTPSITYLLPHRIPYNKNKIKQSTVLLK